MGLSSGAFLRKVGRGRSFPTPVHIWGRWGRSTGSSSQQPRAWGRHQTPAQLCPSRSFRCLSCASVTHNQNHLGVFVSFPGRCFWKCPSHCGVCRDQRSPHPSASVSLSENREDTYTVVMWSPGRQRSGPSGSESCPSPVCAGSSVGSLIRESCAPSTPWCLSHGSILTGGPGSPALPLRGQAGTELRVPERSGLQEDVVASQKPWHSPGVGHVG